MKGLYEIIQAGEKEGKAQGLPVHKEEEEIQTFAFHADRPGQAEAPGGRSPRIESEGMGF